MDRATADLPKYAADLETDLDGDIQKIKKSVNKVWMKEISHKSIHSNLFKFYSSK